MSWLRAALLLGIVALYLLAVPWFREPGAAPEVVFGLPDWTDWALGCFIGVALLNAFVWQLTPLDDDDHPEDSP